MDLVIVDDEPLARDRLHRLVTALDHDIVATAACPDTALKAIYSCKPDIVLLDIEMPGGNGLQVAEQLTELENPPAIIFTTAYGQYALDAFATIAVGYLLKPIQKAQLEQALIQAQAITRAQLSAQQEQEVQQPAAQHITVRSHRGIDLIPIESIRCFLADSKYITVMCPEGEFLMDGTLKQLEVKFSTHFTRVHRNAMVATHYIDGLNRAVGGHYSVRLKGITHQPVVSRRYAGKVKRLLKSL
ncbi:DNA-binding response regulator [Candidatus Endobugula sertula]|uniref:DNA-binding response regulator n=1 Tax=Candidatus Endobugula sertula TaxID=62101 RepID=A0A1D2QNU9_9GAMM|nr:DNA-binding response regulator [Candidatus Endobugula sertula]